MNRGVNVVNLEAVHGMAIRESLAISALPEFFGRAYGQIGEYIGRKGGQIAGAPFAVYYNVNEQSCDVQAVMPAVFDVLENLPAEGEILPVDFPSGEAMEYVYFGPYDGLHTAYGEIEQWLKNHGKTAEGPPREVYYSEPEGDPKDWETHIIQPFQ